MKKLVGLVALLAACSKDTVHHLADAPPGIDASAIDAAPAPVTLTITQDGTPVPDVKVIFQGPDSTLVSSTTTGADGVASATMPHGGYVTAIDPFPTRGGSALTFATVTGNHDLDTFADVKPGDHLTLTDNNGVAVPSASMTINLPTDATATGYYIYSSCAPNGNYASTYVPAPAVGSGSAITPTTTAYLSTSCNATTDLLVVSLDNLSRDSKYFVAPAVAISAGGTLDLTASTFTNVVATPINFTTIPATLQSGYYSFSYLDGTKGPYRVNAQTLYFYPGIGSGSGGPGTLPRMTPAGATLVEYVESYGNSNYSRHDSYRWGQAVASDGSLTYDGTHYLQDISSYPAFDAPSNAVVWTSNAGKTPDLYLASVYFNRPSAPSGLSWTWNIAGAYTGLLSATYPKLPTDFADFNPIDGDTNGLNNLGLASVPGGWDTVREHIFDIGNPGELVAGASGNLEVEAFYNNVGFKAGAPAAPSWPWFAKRTTRTPH